MLIESIDTGYSLKESGTTSNINERANYTANTGQALISVANPNLDGSGTTYTVITGAGNGTLIKNIIIKATGNTTRGMVRLFVSGFSAGRGFTALIDETEIPAVIASATQPAFEINYEMDYYLASGKNLLASTQNDESFVVTAEGLDLSYP